MSRIESNQMSRSDSAAGELPTSLGHRARQRRSPQRAFGHVVRLEFRQSLSGWTLFGAVLIAFEAAIALLCCAVWFAGASGIYVHSRPLLLPVQVIAGVGYLYVLYRAALGNLPAGGSSKQHWGWTAGSDTLAPVAARVVALVVVFGLLLLILIPPLLLAAWVSNLVIPPALLWSLLTLPLGAGLVASAGLFIAAATGRTEEAVVVATVAVATSLVLQYGHLILAALPSSSPYRVMLPLLRAARNVVPYVSPFAAADAMLEAALRSDVSVLSRLGLVSVLGIALWLAATCAVLRRKGRRS